MLPEVSAARAAPRCQGTGWRHMFKSLQMALGIAAAGYDCRVAVDAVVRAMARTSRSLERLRQAGIGLVTG